MLISLLGYCLLIVAVIAEQISSWPDIIPEIIYNNKVFLFIYFSQYMMAAR